MKHIALAVVLAAFASPAHAVCTAQATAKFSAYHVETGRELVIKKGDRFDVEEMETIRNKFDKPVTTMSGYGIVYHFNGRAKLNHCIKKWNAEDERYDLVLDTRRLDARW